MGIAYIPTTISAFQGEVFLFETECIALVEYELDGNEIYDFEITGFRFDRTEGRWDGEVFTPVVVAQARCPDDLCDVLRRYADYAAIEQLLIDNLLDTGEIKASGNAELRADYRAAVL